jgi:hypothetical protein
MNNTPQASPLIALAQAFFRDTPQDIQRIPAGAVPELYRSSTSYWLLWYLKEGETLVGHSSRGKTGEQKAVALVRAYIKMCRSFGIPLVKCSGGRGVPNAWHLITIDEEV